MTLGGKIQVCRESRQEKTKGGRENISIYGDEKKPVSDSKSS